MVLLLVTEHQLKLWIYSIKSGLFSIVFQLKKERKEKSKHERWIGKIVLTRAWPFDSWCWQKGMESFLFFSSNLIYTQMGLNQQYRFITFTGYAYTYHKQLVHIEQACGKRIEKMAKKLFGWQANRQRILDSRHWCPWQLSDYGKFIYQTITIALDWFIWYSFNLRRSFLKRAYQKLLKFVQITHKRCTALKLVVSMVKAWTFPNHRQINSKYIVWNWWGIWRYLKVLNFLHPLRTALHWR